jgi:capsular polysaccharide biosynthesis protein
MQGNQSAKALESDINLIELIHAELSNLHWIILFALLFSGMMFAYSYQSVKPQFQGEKTYSVKTHIKDSEVFAQYINSDEFLAKIITSLSLDSTIEQFRSKVTISPLLASSDLDSTYFKVQVKWPDRIQTTSISDLIAQNFEKEAPGFFPLSETIILGSKVEMTINPANVIMQRIVIGGVLGGIIAAGFVLVSYLFDFRIRSANELVEYTKIPAVAFVKVKK